MGSVVMTQTRRRKTKAPFDLMEFDLMETNRNGLLYGSATEESAPGEALRWCGSIG
jgi:hypothetical protein